MLRSIQRLRQPLISTVKRPIPSIFESKTFALFKSPLHTLNRTPRIQNAAVWATCQHRLQLHTSTITLREQQQQEQKTSEEETVNPKHQMLIGFTCKVCNERSHHVMSKLAYTKGVVLIQCPGCKNRHLIADNLGWFRDSKTTIEDLVKEKGEAIRKVVVDEEGVERLGDLMEWLPEIAEEEKHKKEQQAKLKAVEEQKKKDQDPDEQH